MPILESPAATANAILKGGVAVKLYLGEIGVAPVIVAISVKRGSWSRRSSRHSNRSEKYFLK